MLSPQQVIEKDYLEHRYMLLEIAAYLDRYDAAVQRTGEKPAKTPHQLELLDQAMAILRTPGSTHGRAYDLLELFAT
jgi:hypothetical protein